MMPYTIYETSSVPRTTHPVWLFNDDKGRVFRSAAANMVQMVQPCGGKMAKQLTQPELGRIYQLDDERHSQKEISDIICREFNRETLDRSTVRRHLKGRVSREKINSPITSFCGRGYHSWVVEPVASSTAILNADGTGGAGYLLNTGTRRTCRECGFVEETSMAIGKNKRVVPPRPRIGHRAPYADERL